MMEQAEIQRMSVGLFNSYMKESTASVEEEEVNEVADETVEDIIAPRLQARIQRVPCL